MFSLQCDRPSTLKTEFRKEHSLNRNFQVTSELTYEKFQGWR